MAISRPRMSLMADELGFRSVRFTLRPFWCSVMLPETTLPGGWIRRRIENAVIGRALKHADLTEKKAFFQAYGLLAGQEGLAPLKPLVKGKGLLKRKEDPEIRACAALALGKIGGEEAREVLNAALRDERDPLVRNAINGALREMK